MPRVGLLACGIFLFGGLVYLTANYIQSSSISDSAMTTQSATQDGHDLIPPSVGSPRTSVEELQEQVELTKADEAFLAGLEKVSFGHELFWLTKFSLLAEEFPEYQVGKDELLATLQAHSQVVLESIETILKGYAPLKYSPEKLRLLRLVDQCNGSPELVKQISWNVLSREVISERRDPEKVKNEEDVALASENAVNINVALTAHVLYLSAVDMAEGWEGTKSVIESQPDPWIKSRLAQQYLKKWPAQGELIRHELVQILGSHSDRAPANIEEDNPRE